MGVESGGSSRGSKGARTRVEILRGLHGTIRTDRAPGDEQKPKTRPRGAKEEAREKLTLSTTGSERV